LLLFGGLQPAVAGDNVIRALERPDPSSVTVPDLRFTPTPGDVADYDEYYYFYRQGVSYEQAFADLDQCRMYVLASSLTSVLPPRFVPLKGDVVSRSDSKIVDFYYASYGIVGGLLAGAVMDEENSENARGTNKRCMAYKGYSRYGTTRDIWDRIAAGGDAEKLARMARIASGPEPQAKAIDP
jgi:hypothetical protein